VKRPVDIPLDWTPQQAITVLEFLDTVMISIWCMYGADIVHAERNVQLPQSLLDALGLDDSAPRPAGPEDDIPF
jgi:hypothetical protein